MQLEIISPPYATGQPGDAITFHFPRERIWLMPVM
jgi:hypothetical protein